MIEGKVVDVQTGTNVFEQQYDFTIVTATDVTLAEATNQQLMGELARRLA